MGILYEEDEVKCTECSFSWFKPEEQIQIHVKAPERWTDEDKSKPLPHVGRRIVYKCGRCGTELAR